MQKSKIRTILGLVLVYVAIFLNWQWIWGVLFLVWVIPDLISGITYFMEPVERKEHPLLYWIIVLSWLWMSLYMIATPFFPQLNGQDVGASQMTEELGVYEDKSINSTKQSNLADIKKEKKASAPKATAKPLPAKDKKTASAKKSLAYKSYHQKESHYYIGISVDMNENDPDLEKHTNELWEAFYSNDISEGISNIVDERIYFIYSKADAAGNYKASIAYRTKDIKNVYKGLEGLKIPPSKFAVFEQKGANAEQFIADTWSRIYASDLNFKNGYNMEVYELDANFKVKKAEIRISIK